MKKFLILLKKELIELMTPQMILPFLVGFLAFVLLGNISGAEQRKEKAPKEIAILDLDQTYTSQKTIQSLMKEINDPNDTSSTLRFEVSTYQKISIDTAISNAKAKNISVVLVIPAGFEKGIANFQPQQIAAYNLIRSFSLSGSSSNLVVTQALTAMNESLSNQLIAQKVNDLDPMNLKHPLITQSFVTIDTKTAQIGVKEIMEFVTSQTTFLPIIMFLVIVIASQIIAVTIASEKENKTLETLLSTPISRISLVIAKMSAAGLIALLAAVFYMFGFNYYMNGVMGTTGSELANPQMTLAINQLGLSLDPTFYLLLGTSLFLSILIALAISLILGAFAESVKQTEGLVAPISLLIMIPYFLSMFFNLETVSPSFRLFIYAIPFSHTFLAAPNLFFHKLAPVVYGIIYEAVFLIVLLVIATRIFSTERILTMKLSSKKGGLFKFDLFKKIKF